MLDNTQQALEDFKKYVIQQARTNLTKGKKNVDKNLYNSLQGFVEKSPAGFRLYFEMEDYESAAKRAEVAYRNGHPLEGLRNKLSEVGLTVKK